MKRESDLKLSIERERPTIEPASAMLNYSRNKLVQLQAISSEEAQLTPKAEDREKLDTKKLRLKKLESYDIGPGLKFSSKNNVVKQTSVDSKGQIEMDRQIHEVIDAIEEPDSPDIRT